jgi:protein TonB
MVGSRKIIIGILLVIASAFWVWNTFNRNNTSETIVQKEEVIIEKAVVDSVFVVEKDTIVVPPPVVRRVREEEEIIIPAPPPPPPIVEPPYIPCTIIICFVEQRSQFPGGKRGLHQFLEENIRYPYAAHSQGVQGRVIVSFVIERDGSVVDVRALRGDPLLVGEAVRLVSSMPKWSPANQFGENRRQRFVLPITFRLYE